MIHVNKYFELIRKNGNGFYWSVVYDTIFITFQDLQKVFKFNIRALEGGSLDVRKIVLDSNRMCINENNVRRFVFFWQDS